MFDIFMIGVFIVGLVLAVLSQKIDDKISGSCAGKTVFNANKGLVVLATSFTVGSLSYLICQATCSKTVSEGNNNLNIFIGFFLLLGVALIVLGVMITGNLENKDNINDKKCLEAKEMSKQVIYLGIFMITLCVAYFGYRIYSADEIVLKRGKKNKKSPPPSVELATI